VRPVVSIWGSHTKPAGLFRVFNLKVQGSIEHSSNPQLVAKYILVLVLVERSSTLDLEYGTGVPGRSAVRVRVS
jgi:hypothetical protein